MGGDLGAGDAQVHDSAAAVLRFWFEETPADKHFARDADLDTAIYRRFGALREDLLVHGVEDWRDDPDTVLAAIVVLDQFSRNIYRADEEAFAADRLAADLTRDAIANGWEERYPPERRAFLYLPLMHAEDAGTQALSVDRYEALGIENNLKFARAHAEVIARFGRFPSRNAALRRTSTPQEKEYLTQPGAGW